MAVNYFLIGRRIRSIRNRRGFSQMTLSEMIDRSPTYLSYIENGVKGMSLDTFVLIANALNASADELLMDNLENTITASNHAFAEIVADCSEYEKRVLIDILISTKEALRENAMYFRLRHG